MLCGVHVAAAVVDGVAVSLAVLARRLVHHAVALPTHPDSTNYAQLGFDTRDDGQQLT